MNEPSQAELDDLIAQATVDCYSEDEELTGQPARPGSTANTADRPG